MVGATLGHYRIVRQIGAGGMGEVYAAEDVKLGRQVALKVLPQSLSADPERRERFVREARAVASLNHPNIVTLHSVDEADGVVFLTMELVEGQPLSEAIPRGGLPLSKLLKIAIALADAVAAAHQRGITHRDLKPANVMITADGRVKVLDFGLAKLKAEALQAAGAESTMSPQDLTGEGRILGTAAYMSPEQAETKPIDHRSDIFSLGIILYELATGDRPFKGDTSVSVISSIIKDTPTSVTDLRRDLPRDLARIVKRCLVKDPEHRYQTAKDLRNDLELLEEETHSGDLTAAQALAQARAARSPRRWIVAGALAAIAALVVAAYLLRGSRAAPASDRFREIRVSRLTNNGKVNLAAISRDGKYLAYTTSENRRQSLWVRQVATTSNVLVVQPAEERYKGVTFSTDGNHIYYAWYAANENYAWLYQVPALGGTPRKLLYDVDTSPTFSPDGKQIAFVRGNSRVAEETLMIANADGTAERALAVSKQPDVFPQVGVAWSPDGKVIVVPRFGGSPRAIHLEAVDAHTGKVTPLGARGWADLNSVAWVSDTALVTTAYDRDDPSGDQIWLVAYPGGEARKVTSDLNGYFSVSATGDGRTLVSMQGSSESQMWAAPDGDAARARQITSGTGKYPGNGSLDWTPDGRIVFTSAESGHGEIWIMDADGGNARQLTPGPDANYASQATPDGRYIVFLSARNGDQDLWRIDIDGGNPVQLTRGVSPGPPVLLDGGASVYFTSFGAAERRTLACRSRAASRSRRSVSTRRSPRCR